MESGTALLGCANGFTTFSHAGRTIRFRAPYSLERYVDVDRWDNGYIVALAKYAHNDVPEEEYIDLVPILSDLYIEPRPFLDSITSVEVHDE